MKKIEYYKSKSLKASNDDKSRFILEIRVKISKKTYFHAAEQQSDILLRHCDIAWFYSVVLSVVK